MNQKAVEEFDPDTGEISSNLPATIGPGGSLAVALARSEIDQQISTARAMPRSIKRAVDNVLMLATLDEETSAECVYALPRAGKPIKGPSVRLAEIVASQYGNCRVGARVVHVDRFEKFVEAEGVFHDLETNTATTARVRRRISDKRGRLFNDDMIVVTGNAACSIAKRNAILGGVPKAIWRRAYKAVEAVIAGDVKTLVERRGQAMKAFAAFGVTPEQIFVALEVKGLDDIGLDELTTLIGMHSALKNGESTVEDMFPKPRIESEQRERKTLDGFVERESLQGSDSDQRTADDDPAPAVRSDSRSGPEESGESGGKRQASELSESSDRPSATAAGASPSYPASAGEYYAHATAWIKALRNADVGVVQWNAEKTLRDQCNVESSVHDKLQALLRSKLRELGDGGQRKDAEDGHSPVATASQAHPVQDAEAKIAESGGAKGDSVARTAGANPATGAKSAEEKGQVDAAGDGRSARASSSPPTPKTASEYITYAKAWIADVADIDAAKAKWNAEKKARNSLNVPIEARDDLAAFLSQRLKHLEDVKISDYDDVLVKATQGGTAALDAAWAAIPNDRKPQLEKAMQRRHRPAARDFDAKK